MDNTTLVSKEEVKKKANPYFFRISICLLFSTIDCKMQDKASVDFISALTNWIRAMTWGGYVRVVCPFSGMFCYFVHSVAIFWKALTEVSSLGTAGFRFSHTGSHPWAGCGMKSSLCHVTGQGCHASTPQLDVPLGCHQPLPDTGQCPKVCLMCLHSA